MKLIGSLCLITVNVRPSKLRRSHTTFASCDASLAVICELVEGSGYLPSSCWLGREGNLRDCSLWRGSLLFIWLILYGSYYQLIGASCWCGEEWTLVRFEVIKAGVEERAQIASRYEVRQFKVQFRQGGELNIGETYLEMWKQLLWKLFETDKDKKNRSWRP